MFKKVEGGISVRFLLPSSHSSSAGRDNVLAGVLFFP